MSRFKWLEFGPTKKTPGKSDDAGLDDSVASTPGVDMTDPLQVLQIAEETYRKLNYEKALTLYSKALGFDPNAEEAWAGQLRCLLDLQENPEALTWSIKAQKMFPKNSDIISARALALARQGNLKEAMEFSDGAMKNEKLGWFTWVTRGEILALSGSANAEFCMMKAREIRATDWFVVLKVAQAYSHTPLVEKAPPLFKKVLASQPDLPEAWFELGDIQLNLGFSKEANESFSRANKLAPMNGKYSDAFLKTENMGFADRFMNWVKSIFKGV